LDVLVKIPAAFSPGPVPQLTLGVSFNFDRNRRIAGTLAFADNQLMTTMNLPKEARTRTKSSTVFRVIAMPQSTADLVRRTMRAPGYGHPASIETATGYGPCRLCLRAFRIGEDRRILFTFDPFYQLEPLPLPGPVFIHERECMRCDENAGFPEDMRHHRLTLNAYGDGRRLVAQEYVEDAAVEQVIEHLFADSRIRYIHVRDTEAGCYDFRVERA
jgi:Protein of unknown function (DUF1203)